MRNDYLTPERLASSYVDTPDFRRECPSIGQRILVYWDLPAYEVYGNRTELVLHLRFRNSQYEIIREPITTERGTYCYLIEDEKYCCTQGVLTYKVEVQVNDCVAHCWRHQIWVQPISIHDNREGMQELG